ncbi:SgcJ/EcaC family oxidoreductase [Qipengyuania soli]|uniref:SgcJ/EcaC family oxidoreductase n=2 Tax=Qipengyuania soli TaxID=2782568 RepID=A0A7S8F7C9_9SPHN|nr:SgcJ/EcaC family oxidoreductase [Qipengyuania soli]
MLLVATSLTLASCDTPNEQATAVPPEAAAPADTAAEEQAIRAQVARWHDLIKAKDAAAIAQLYVEDGAFMPANAPIAKGRAAIEQNWAGLIATPGFDLAISPEQIVVSSSGDLAMDRGTYRLTVAPDGKEQVEIGKYVVVWRKVEGEWKAAADIINSDLPPGGG